MEHFRVRVKQLERRRIEYFLFTPDNSLEQYSRDIREGASDLLQEIPLNISVDTKQYLIGKILNIMPDFEVKCEEFLEQSLRANSTRTDAWLELGQCVWKRGDLVKAHACFKEAVEREHSPKALCLLSAALRALSNRCVDGGQRVQMLNEAIRNCQEALLRHRKSYAFAYYSLANTFLARFFALQQSSGQDLSLALDAFATALKTPICCALATNADTTQHQQQQQLPFINPDLHLSYGLALYYGQFYAKALAQFRRALTIEPHFGQAKRQFDSARTFLCALRNGLRRKGNIAKRRLRSLVDTFPKSASIDERRLLEKHVGGGGLDNPARTLAICSNLSELPSSSNESAVETVVSLAVRCVGFVNNDDKIPCVIICIDRTAAVVALTVYNCSTKFGALIGDTFTVLQPNLIRLRWKELELNDEDGCGAEGEKLDKNSGGTTDNDGEQQLLLIRVTNPQRQLLKNGRPLTALECAFASMQIETQQK